MSVVAPIPDISVAAETNAPQSTDKTESRSSTQAAWFEVRPEHLPVWNSVLLDTSTSLYQYPFWNEPYRPLWLTPRYLAWGTQDRPQAFVSILTIGFGPAKIGLVFRGPTCIHSRAGICSVAIGELVRWARSHGYIFIRFTHHDPEVLGKLAATGRADNFDAFPYFLDYPIISPDYVVSQSDSDEETLAGFDREVRRKLRRATELGYQFCVETSPEALQRAWPLYQDCSRRKQFRLERPLSVYMEAMRLGQVNDCVRLYSVHHHGKLVGSTLVFRDRDTAHCQLAAFDVQHRQAAVFLHWHAMRDMYRVGARRYNMGPGPGSLARFKRQFCQTPVAYPGAITVVTNETLYRTWKFVFPVAKSLRPTLRKIVTRLKS
ncbi:MAG TPA: GNAT family N-acetyltransferase [Candidatus Solibacter sp.]|nr:GNAT family N-acetyltransferase [Candidatus Solibacter sp.]